LRGPDKSSCRVGQTAHRLVAFMVQPSDSEAEKSQAQKTVFVDSARAAALERPGDGEVSALTALPVAAGSETRRSRPAPILPVGRRAPEPREPGPAPQSRLAHLPSGSIEFKRKFDPEYP